MLRYFSYGHAAKIFLIKYKVVQASQKKQHTIPAEVLPNDSEALSGFLVSENSGNKASLSFGRTLAGI